MICSWIRKNSAGFESRIVSGFVRIQIRLQSKSELSPLPLALQWVRGGAAGVRVRRTAIATRELVTFFCVTQFLPLKGAKRVPGTKLTICAIHLTKSIAQMAKPEHRWGTFENRDKTGAWYQFVAMQSASDLSPSPFGFAKGEGWRSRGEGSTHCVCYEAIG